MSNVMTGEHAERSVTGDGNVRIAPVKLDHVGGNMSDEDSSGGGYTPSYRWIWAIPAFGFLGVAVSLIYISQVPSAVRWSVFGTALGIAAAATLTGGVVGFLFGIPHTVQGSASSTDETQYHGNTNLEQVSDWLTKIIVGVGLVQIGRALPVLTRLAENLKAPLGGQASSAAFGLALIISYALLGFVYFYLWSRTGFQEELRRINILPRLSRLTAEVEEIERHLDAPESRKSSSNRRSGWRLSAFVGATAAVGLAFLFSRRRSSSERPSCYRD